jgi:hypothetical protein
MHTEIAQGSVFARTIPGFVDVNILSGLLFYKDDRTAGFVYGHKIQLAYRHFKQLGDQKCHTLS